jgi:hypothetical protein
MILILLDELIAKIEMNPSTVDGSSEDKEDRELERL